MTTTKTRRTPRVRGKAPAATAGLRTISRGDLERAARLGSKEGGPHSRPRADPSTANDLNAGRGTEGPREDSDPISQPTGQGKRGTSTARTKRDDLPKPSPDGATSNNASASAYETEGLVERTSRSDVEGGVAG